MLELLLTDPGLKSEEFCSIKIHSVKQRPPPERIQLKYLFYLFGLLKLSRILQM